MGIKFKNIGLVGLGMVAGVAVSLQFSAVAQKATPAPIDQAVDMLRLTSKASELFLEQTAAEQRRLLQVVVEKAAWQDGASRTTLFEPFEILRHSNQESYRKEKDKTRSGRELEIWLLDQDSNLRPIG